MRVSHTGKGPVQGGDVSEARNTEKGAPAHAAKNAGREPRAAEATRTAHGDARTEISSKSKAFGHAKAVATAAPDTRDERIAELKKRISAGDYKVDSDAVADRMVDDHLRMSGIGGGE